MLTKKVINDIQWAVSFLQKSGHWPMLPSIAISAALPTINDDADVISDIAKTIAPFVKKTPQEVGVELKAQLRPRYEKITIKDDGRLLFLCTEDDARAAFAHVARKDFFHHAKNNRPCTFVLLHRDLKLPFSLSEMRTIIVGDVLANVYAFFGWSVRRTMRVDERPDNRALIGESVTRRYLQRVGVNVVYEEPLLPGEYFEQLAARLDLPDYKMTTQKKMEWIKNRVAQSATEMMMRDVKEIVEKRLRITIDEWGMMDMSKSDNAIVITCITEERPTISYKKETSQSIGISSNIALREGDRRVKAVKPDGDGISAAEFLDAFAPDAVRLLFLLSPRTTVCDCDLHRLEENANDNPLHCIQRAVVCLQKLHDRMEKTDAQDNPAGFHYTDCERVLFRYCVLFTFVVDHVYATGDVSMLAQFALQCAASIERFTDSIAASKKYLTPAQIEMLTIAENVFTQTLQLLGIPVI